MPAPKAHTNGGGLPPTRTASRWALMPPARSASPGATAICAGFQVQAELQSVPAFKVVARPSNLCRLSSPGRPGNLCRLSRSPAGFQDPGASAICAGLQVRRERSGYGSLGARRSRQLSSAARSRPIRRAGNSDAIRISLRRPFWPAQALFKPKCDAQAHSDSNRISAAGWVGRVGCAGWAGWVGALGHLDGGAHWLRHLDIQRAQGSCDIQRAQGSCDVQRAQGSSMSRARTSFSRSRRKRSTRGWPTSSAYSAITSSRASTATGKNS